MVCPKAGSRAVCCWAAFGQACPKSKGAQWDEGSQWAEFMILSLKHEWSPVTAHSLWSLQQGLEKSRGNYLRPDLHVQSFISDQLATWSTCIPSWAGCAPFRGNAMARHTLLILPCCKCTAQCSRVRSLPSASWTRNVSATAFVEKKIAPQHMWWWGTALNRCFQESKINTPENVFQCSSCSL